MTTSPFEILKHPLNCNDSGAFVELARQKEISFRQVSLCIINPGCTRGGHFHRRKEEWFGVVQGEMLLRFEKDNGQNHEMVFSEKEPILVRIPPGTKHTVMNRTKQVCKFIILANEEFDPDDPDTFRS